ncbi:carboxypeptidase b [Trichoderma arundinaceum]|uniref:Carboxypeptidase b n=1 Tax=Trichoderma arundinaceum TaxID=490622 RepID=A0A395NPL5_TRIAR|nr:carboxypeptidase b [Trichoderma arundinaceum]
MKASISLLIVLGVAIQACLMPEELRWEVLRKKGKAPQIYPDYLKTTSGRDKGNGLRVGVKGQRGKDRFLNGSVLPQGIGRRTDIPFNILNLKEIESGIRGLVNNYEYVRHITGRYRTYENREIHGFRIGDNPIAYIQSGVHARERGGPDNLLFFFADLLDAAWNGKGLTYGRKSYSAREVRDAVSVDVVVVPAINLDGIAWDQRTNTCWRKNRRPATTGHRMPGTGTGVDLDRNFDFLWDYKRYFDVNTYYKAANIASDYPASLVYHGVHPASEPETRNVVEWMQEYTNVSWFVDIHSFSSDHTGSVFYAWGDDDTQYAEPELNFLNSTYDGIRGRLDESPDRLLWPQPYREYMEEEDIRAQVGLARNMAAGMTATGNLSYLVDQHADIGPKSGSATDYFLSKYYGHRCNASLINGITIQFGAHSGLHCPFYPDLGLYQTSMKEVAAGLMEFLLWVKDVKGQNWRAKKWKCETENAKPNEDGGTK